MSYSDDDTWSTAHPDQVPASCCQTFPKGDAYCSTKDNPDVYPDVSFITLVKGGFQSINQLHPLQKGSWRFLKFLKGAENIAKYLKFQRGPRRFFEIKCRLSCGVKSQNEAVFLDSWWQLINWCILVFSSHKFIILTSVRKIQHF